MNDLFTSSFNSMILSASGWRTIFTLSGNENDTAPLISCDKKMIAVFAGAAFAQFMIERTGNSCTLAVGMDSRPTGPEIAEQLIKPIITRGIQVHFLGIAAAPEIMAYARGLDGFVYISASHNPVGHNGIKFGKNDGGVISADEAKLLIKSFKNFCSTNTPEKDSLELSAACSVSVLKKVYELSPTYKQAALSAYASFTQEVVSGETQNKKQEEFFEAIRQGAKQKPLSIIADMNGSARTLSIDADFLLKHGLGFFSINNLAGQIVHGIIPEPENLVYCAAEMERLQAAGYKDVLLAYMPDCDGDRGNIVYWNEKMQKAEILKAQEVFALSVMAELAYSRYGKNPDKLAVAVNCPTSMRIEKIAEVFGALVARAEVGEANVVNRARELRREAYTVPILGEGSNGGNITHPAAVRDPMNTLFALIKLLLLRDTEKKQGLFHIWCSLSGQENLYKNDFSLADIIASLPVFTTTGVSDERAILRIKTADQSLLKKNFQILFSADWEENKKNLLQKYGIAFWQAAATLGTKEYTDIKDFSFSGTGGLKILLQNQHKQNIAFMWMRGSGTEPVFRLMCDVQGNHTDMEQELLAWERNLLEKADKM